MAMLLDCTGGGCRAARLAFTTLSFQSVTTSAVAGESEQRARLAAAAMVLNAVMKAPLL
jgi:hypothetical protein